MEDYRSASYSSSSSNLLKDEEDVIRHLLEPFDEMPMGFRQGGWGSRVGWAQWRRFEWRWRWITGMV
ncbi:hypothetical protein SLEP1_g26452 [Rubroshorea leprosula]|uniref:Uncharacterized protein n=1 Tax=Rubroshorea leprosula TaxID=152421 RepID=A0AAV5JPY9_9ROSI|nr:hypothetical protein SLEP1_g26452 [Rubroshorea leprosula]